MQLGTGSAPITLRQNSLGCDTELVQQQGKNSWSSSIFASTSDHAAVQVCVSAAGAWYLCSDAGCIDQQCSWLTGMQQPPLDLRAINRHPVSRSMYCIYLHCDGSAQAIYKMASLDLLLCKHMLVGHACCAAGPRHCPQHAERATPGNVLPAQRSFAITGPLARRISAAVAANRQSTTSNAVDTAAAWRSAGQAQLQPTLGPAHSVPAR